MTSIAQLKRELKFKKKLKGDPVGTLGQIFGEQQPDKFSSFFFKAMEDMVQKITSEAVDDLLKNDKMLNALANIAAARAFNSIRTPVDGIEGVKGDKGEKGDSIVGPQGKAGKDGKNGNTPIAGIDFPIPENGKDGNEIEPDEIVKKINLLPENGAKIDAKHIKNLPKGKDTREGQELFRGGLKIIWNTVLDGTVNGTNKVFTVPSGTVSPKDDRFIIEARGGIKSVDNGDFVASNGNRTITFTNAPPDGSNPPRIILHHGK